MAPEQENRQSDVPSVEQKKNTHDGTKSPSGSTMWAGVAIFVVAVIAVLVYAGQTELDGVTLALLLFVLFFGEVFVALQWYSTSRQNSRTSAKQTLMKELEEKLGEFTGKHKGLFSSLTTTDKELKASVESLDKTTKYIVSRLDEIAAGRVQMELTSLEIEQIANRSAEKVSALPALNKPQKKDDGSAVAKAVTGAVVAEISNKLEGLENTQKEILKRLAELEATTATPKGSPSEKEGEAADELEPEEEEQEEIEDTERPRHPANADEPELEEIPEEPAAEDDSSQEDEAPEIEEEELPEEEGETEDVSEEDSAEEDVEEDPEIDEILKEEEEDVEENEGGEGDVSEDDDAEEEESTEEASLDSSEEELPLVEDLPHTALILTVKLSKGQKPFLRGNAPGLSETRSTPMEYSGNNRWRFDFDAMRENADITVFLDDTDEKLGEFNLQAGKVTQLAFSPEK